MGKNVAIVGASGYTGAELIRLIATHPDLNIAALAANSKAGQSMAGVFPHLRHLDLPSLVTWDAIDYFDNKEKNFPKRLGEFKSQTVRDAIKEIKASSGPCATMA